MNRINSLKIDSNTKQVYVIGDIHGKANELHKLLTNIQFDTKKDIIITVGDLIARGESSTGVVEYFRGLMEEHPESCICVMGNHELRFIEKYHDPQQRDDCYHETMAQFQDYYNSDEKIAKIVEWMKNLPRYLMVEVNDQVFYITHKNPYTEGPLVDMGQEESSGENAMEMHSNHIVVCGHEMTCLTRRAQGEDPEDITIYESKGEAGKYYNVDCGCFQTGLLGALRLNDLKEFYSTSL